MTSDAETTDDSDPEETESIELVEMTDAEIEAYLERSVAEMLTER
ncbi:MAG: hypothetical protein ABEI99_09760 [Halobaculum sp.]